MNLQIKRRKSRIEVVPMIDVLFFMLVFFMVFSTLKTAQTGVVVELPKALHIGSAQQNNVVISIDKNANVFYGQKQVGLGELGPTVTAELQKDPTTQFVVKPDATVAYKSIVQVMDTLAAAGVEKPVWGVDRQQIPKQTVSN